jgi:acetoin:2,6-dichlorophenolindophenol oxidoreductase subunit alpha
METVMQLTKNKMIEMYKTMVRIRQFEETVSQLTATGTISGFVHLCIGQEAVATGVCSSLRDTDFISTTHRGHGHMIAKGGKTDLMMAELFAKSNGYCKGKGGSMHIADMDIGILGANGIVGGGPPLTVGAALSAQYKGSDNVSICFFGDGASNQGSVHESMNLAAVWKLPVIFVVENNGLGEFTHQVDHQCITDVADRAAGYGMPGLIVDGNDVEAVWKGATETIKRARSGGGPSLLECKTFRISGHYEGDVQGYRNKDEIKEWQKPDKDPVLRFESKLLESAILTKKKIQKIRQDAKKEIDQAVETAKSSPTPDPAELLTDVYAE